jgi:hypothetical protein
MAVVLIDGTSGNGGKSVRVSYKGQGIGAQGTESEVKEELYISRRTSQFSDSDFASEQQRIIIISSLGKVILVHNRKRGF